MLEFRIKTRLRNEQTWTCYDGAMHQTLNPSALKHCRWASIHLPQASSPCCTMHSSLNFFVSGQAQQIFFFGFVSGGGACSFLSVGFEASVAPDAVFPISENKLEENYISSKMSQEDYSLIIYIILEPV
ncbi:hypothetical protein ABZP36_035857 [Zizania latifolia]